LDSGDQISQSGVNWMLLQGGLPSTIYFERTSANLFLKGRKIVWKISSLGQDRFSPSGVNWNLLQGVCIYFETNLLLYPVIITSLFRYLHRSLLFQMFLWLLDDKKNAALSIFLFFFKM